MSIYINGMNMPEKQVYVILNPNGLVEVLDANNVLLEEYQSVSVPPHGRLGDLDELAKRIEYEQYYHAHTDSLAIRHHIAEYRHFLYAINTTPVIIPAEENNNDR